MTHFCQPIGGGRRETYPNEKNSMFFLSTLLCFVLPFYFYFFISPTPGEILVYSLLYTRLVYNWQQSEIEQWNFIFYIDFLDYRHTINIRKYIFNQILKR